MIFFNNSQEKVRNIIKKIENGNAGESNIVALCELLENHQDIVPESIVALNNIIKKGNIKAFNLAIYTFNKMSGNYIGFEYYSVDVILSCIKERKSDLREKGMLDILVILSKITQKYPERMRIAIPELLTCLENTDSKIREISHFILSILAASHHEFFNDHSKGFIRVLNGLYVDERIYACRLIKQLAMEQSIVNDTYDLLDDLRLNNPDSNLRSEAGFAFDRLKQAAGKKSSRAARSVRKVQKRPNTLAKDKIESPENYYPGLDELTKPNKKDLIDVLEGMDLRHMIVNR